MEYVTFIETNHKEKEQFIFYLPWTGNEEVLTWLYEIVSTADFSDMSGDFSEFEMDIDKKLSEDVVDAHCDLPYGDYMPMFNKPVGKQHKKDWFESWREYEGCMDMSPQKLAEWLNDVFFGGHIPLMFV